MIRKAYEEADYFFTNIANSVVGWIVGDPDTYMRFPWVFWAIVGSVLASLILFLTMKGMNASVSESE